MARRTSRRLLAADFDDFDDGKTQNSRAASSVEDLMEGTGARCFGLGSFDDVFIGANSASMPIASQSPTEKLYAFAIIAPQIIPFDAIPDCSFSFNGVTIGTGPMWKASSAVIFRPLKDVRAYSLPLGRLDGLSLNEFNGTLSARLDGLDVAWSVPRGSISAARAFLPAQQPTTMFMPQPTPQSVQPIPAFSFSQPASTPVPTVARPVSVQASSLVPNAENMPGPTWPPRSSAVTSASRRASPLKRRYFNGEALDDLSGCPDELKSRLLAAQDALQRDVASALERYHTERAAILGQFATKSSSSTEIVAPAEREMCGLCCSASEDKELKPCGHRLCTDCVSRLSATTLRCPWCRQDVGEMQSLVDPL